MLSSNISYIWADSFPLPDRGVTSLRLSDHLSPNGFPELASPRVTTNDSWQVLYSPIDWPELQTWNNAQACKQCLCKFMKYCVNFQDFVNPQTGLCKQDSADFDCVT